MSEIYKKNVSVSVCVCVCAALCDAGSSGPSLLCHV